MTHVLTVIGARPQFIKASPVSRALSERAIKETLVHTGQHYDTSMSLVFFEELGIPAPHVHLNIGSGSHGAQTGRMLAAIEQTMIAEQPDVVMVYGDTNSTLAGALAAAKLHIPIAHVEAGLRSGNRRMPEEINRIVTDSISDVLFAPTSAAVDNLASEGRPPTAVVYTGDVMYDAALLHGAEADRRSNIRDTLSITGSPYILATVHRAENTDDLARLGVILGALGVLSQEIGVVLPLHPRTRHLVEADAGLRAILRDSRLIDPVGYLDMISLERGAALIVTDSGGVQKEAFFHSVPCVTLREETEWVELIASGWNRLCPPTSTDDIVSTCRAALGTLGSVARPYGEGDASVRIAEFLAAHY